MIFFSDVAADDLCFLFVMIFFSDAAADDLTWYPKQKVQIARRKLQGANPCHITKYVLAQSQSMSYYQVRISSKPIHVIKPSTY